MRKETLIIIFYAMYFTWLFFVTFLTTDTAVLTYFTLAISVFYLLFLKEPGDISWFLLASLIPIIYAFFTNKQDPLMLRFESLRYFPFWLALAWGTTTVALRKLYFLLTK